MNRELFDLDSGKLLRYLELRGLNQTDLADKAEISRGSVSSYCNGNSKPSIDTTHRIVRALNVQFKDLVKDGEEIPIGEIHQELKELINRSYPSVLKSNLPYLRKLLMSEESDKKDLLEFLMLKANLLGIAQFKRLLEMLKASPQIYEGYSTKISVYYVQNEEDTCEYECLVKFEPWVYEYFGMEDDNQFIPVHLATQRGSADWYPDIVDELQTIIYEDVANTLEGLYVEAFDELLNEAYWQEPEEWYFTEVDPLRKVKAEQKTIRLSKLFVCLVGDGADTDTLAKAAADEEFAAELFEKYKIE